MGMNLNNLLAIVWAIAVSQSVLASELTSRNWGLYNMEMASHIDARKAWDLASGEGVKICVVDTGIDANHEAFHGRLCVRDGVDEYGWDFVAKKKNPSDVDSHGTHVAGIALAVAPKSCIIPVKWYKPDLEEFEKLDNIASSIKYCMVRGAKIINFSGSGRLASNKEREQVEAATRAGILFVTAAGNDYADIDQEFQGAYPASYRLQGAFISVASQNISNRILASSNYGFHTVDVAAPGENINSALPGNKYGYKTGTSMAAPFVSGIAALVWSKYPKLTADEVKRVIVESVDREPALTLKVRTGGKVNAYKALLKAKEFDLQRKNGGIR